MKTFFIGIGAAFLIVGGIIFLASRLSSTVVPSDGNVTLTGDTQVISISAKGGYAPRATVAKANVATQIQMATNGTFDCSAALTIPSLGYRVTLPPSGSTVIEVPPQAPGTTLRGICQMGMFSFTIAFK